MQPCHTALLATFLAATALPAPALASPPWRPEVVGGTQHGKASYYHARFNGRRMANGERFDPNEAVAAHRTLPFGTVVLVTNLENGRSAVVRVADRGPFVRGRIIDLAPGIAARLDMVGEGVVAVAVTRIGMAAEGEEAGPWLPAASE